MQNDNNVAVGILGASSFVGLSLLEKLKSTSMGAVAYTRREIKNPPHGVVWRRLAGKNLTPTTVIPCWICLAPIAVLPDYFSMLEAHGVRRLVAMSSTSRFTKISSPDANEQALVRNLALAEERVQEWASRSGVEWIILRPTLIYGGGQDRNITEITRFIRRFGFFPVFGKACGLRQPIHVHDVAGACLTALQSAAATNRSYNISGAETLSYRDMVIRIFSVLNRKPRLVSIPLWMFSAAVLTLRLVPRYRKWSSAMAQRMNCDMVFDHSEVHRDFEFKPRSFNLSAEDLPR